VQKHIFVIIPVRSSTLLVVVGKSLNFLTIRLSFHSSCGFRHLVIRHIRHPAFVALLEQPGAFTGRFFEVWGPWDEHEYGMFPSFAFVMD
jgi:hypothetical protein